MENNTKRPSTHPRDMKARIYRAVLCATDQEIHDGMSFYPGAYGLCKMFAAMFLRRMPWLTISHVAGIYAALSPMNGWEENVANMLDVLRWQSIGGVSHELPRVNTPNPNLQKALKIAAGAEPLSVLRGAKVSAFYRGISNPEDRTPIPVDRHLLALACGVAPNKNELSSMASDRELWKKVESAYVSVGARESYSGVALGNRIASIAWFVQRRVLRGQTLLLQPSSVICCQRPMHVYSTVGKYVCGVCGVSHAASTVNALPPATIDGYAVSLNKGNNRRIIKLGRQHEYANSAGWQYLSRYIVMRELNRRLTSDEHTHHKDLDKTHDSLDGRNYQLLLAESHGRYHRYLADLAGYRDDLGRFTEHVEPITL